MKKFAFILCIFLLMTTVSYGQSLDYKTAMDMALKNNLQIVRSQDAVDDAKDDLYTGVGFLEPAAYENPVNYIILEGIAFDNLLTGRKVAEKTLNTQKEALVISVASQFVNIEEIENSIKTLKDEIRYNEDVLNVERIKVENGVSSQYDLEKMAADLKLMKNQIDELELKKQAAYNDLKHLINEDPFTYDSISYLKLSYKPLKEQDFDLIQKVSLAQNENTEIIQKQQAIKDLEEKLKYGLMDSTVTGDENQLPPSDQRTKIRLQDTDIRVMKNSIEDAVIQSKNNILDMQNRIASLKKQTEVLKVQLKNAEVLNRYGMNVKLDVDKIKIDIEKNQNEIKTLENKHSLEVQRYERPYLLAVGR